MFDTIKEKFSHIDPWLLIISVLLSAYGLIWIYSASRSLAGSDKFVIVQGLALIIGLIAMVIISNIDYERYEHISKYIYIGSVGLLLLTKLIGQGAEETGTQGWIRFAGIGVQPAEIVKIFFIITFSCHISREIDNINKPKTLFSLFVHFIILAGLVLWQPDIGMVIIYGVIFVGILYVAKISYKYIFGLLGILAVGIPAAWYMIPQGSYIRGRILTFFNPELDPMGSGYNVIQSKIAIGSGQLFGRGYLKGVYNQLGWLPAKQTDFITGVIGEELGFIGVIIALALLLCLILRCFYIAIQSKNFLGSAIATGVGVMFMFHFFENMGMCIGLMPVTGIPLPFLSYGGSSLATNFMAIGLVMSVYSRRKSINF